MNNRNKKDSDLIARNTLLIRNKRGYLPSDYGGHVFVQGKPAQILGILAVLLGIFISSSVGYLSILLIKGRWFKNLGNMQQKNPQEQSTESCQIRPVQIVWETYSNENLGFHIEIPASWEPNVMEQATKTVVQFGKPSENLEITAGVYYNQDLQRELTFQEVVEMHQPTDGQEATDYELAGIQGKKYVYDIGSSTKEILIDLPDPNTKNGVVTFIYYLRPGNTNETETVEKVLSTFKFPEY